MASLQRHTVNELAWLTDTVCEQVSFAFTEKGGGVSCGQWASLNLGASCADDPACVEKNRRLALACVGAEGLYERLVNPHQVHGDDVAVVSDATVAAAGGLAAIQAQVKEGVDAVVCTAADVPVMLCFADCVPVVLVDPAGRGFAIAHSGWRGTVARIGAKAARELARAAGCDVANLVAYVGPHIGAADYEVSAELLERFVAEFGLGANAGENHLDLGFCVREALLAAGIAAGNIAECNDSTASNTHRFFSYRAQGGKCGRHAAIAVLHGAPAQDSFAGAV